MRVRTTGATRALIAVALVSTFALAVFVPAAGAGIEGPNLSAPLTVVKVVDPAHPAPAGTTFTATVHCDSNIIDPGEGADAETVEGLSETTITFDATGQPTSPDTIGFVEGGLCTVTETSTGGAKSVAYACEGVLGTIDSEAPIKQSFDGPSASDVVPPVCATTGPVDPIEVNIFAPDQSATVTITNTFDPEIKPAAQIVAQPAFTG
ncbi:MAG TPA: hypothetical protein VGN51_23220 [Acidimicrobiia bacterium]|jgi:hypothetical protein